MDRENIMGLFIIFLLAVSVGAIIMLFVLEYRIADIAKSLVETNGIVITNDQEIMTIGDYTYRIYRSGSNINVVRINSEEGN